MKCLNCGAEIDDTTKFCGFCGSPVEQQVPPTNSDVQSIEQPTNDFSENAVSMEQPEVINPTDAEVKEEQLGGVNTIGSDVQLEQPQVQQPIPPISNTPNKPKKSNSLIFIIGGAILAIIAVVLIVLSFNKTSKSSIGALEKAINNTIANGKESGTVKASILLESNSQSMNLSGTFKYQKEKDSYKFALTVDESMLFDEMSLFATLDKKNITLYANSSLVDMISGNVSTSDKWIYYSYDLDDIEDSIEDVEFDNEVKLSDAGLDKYFKFINKENGVNHYALTINQKLIDELKSEMTAEEKKEYDMMLSMIPGSSELLEKGFSIDFYINDKDELEKISIDVTKFMEDAALTKAIFTVEFKDFNNTKVTIPSEAKSGIELNKYLSTNVNMSPSMNMSTNMQIDDSMLNQSDLLQSNAFNFNY